MTIPRKILLLATVMGGMLMAAMPAQAGQRTGTWKYSPEDVWAYQQQQQEMAARQAWHARRHHWQQEGYDGYGGGYGRPVYGRPAYGWNGGYREQGGYDGYGDGGYPHRRSWDD
jgi:hypothetical protein